MIDYSQSAQRTPCRVPAALLGQALLIEAVLVAIVVLGDLRQHAALFILLGLAAAVLYWSAIRSVQRTAPAISVQRLEWWVLVPALLFRGTLLFSPPSLSDDIYRYQWDGTVLLHGINPYSHPPQDPQLAFLRGPHYDAINYKEISTIYPPLAQLAFALGALLDLGIWGPKALFWGLELGLLWALSRLLNLLQLGPQRLLIYAWNPLILFEFCGSAHVDVLAVLLLVLTACAIIQERPALSTTLLSLAALAKLIPALLLPVLARWARPLGWIVFGAWIAAGILPFAGAGAGLLRGLNEYAMRWRFNDAAFTLAYEGLRALGVPDPAALFYVKIVVGTALMALIATVALRKLTFVRGTYLVLGLYLLLSPTLHPWYVAWIVPFLCVYPNRAWLMLTGLVLLSYAILVGAGTDSHLWIEPAWTKPAQFIPFYALLSWDAWRTRRLARAEISG